MSSGDKRACKLVGLAKGPRKPMPPPGIPENPPGSCGGNGIAWPPPMEAKSRLYRLGGMPFTVKASRVSKILLWVRNLSHKLGLRPLALFSIYMYVYPRHLFLTLESHLLRVIKALHAHFK